MFFLVTTGIGLIYYFAPDAEQDWVWITPGPLVATCLWLLVSPGFKAYLSYFGNDNETYGAIGAVIVLLTWLYLSSLAILFGAELNSEIEHASPYGKAAGERVPGEKRRLGAARALLRKRRPGLDRGLRCAPRRRTGTATSDVLIAAVSLIPLALKVGRKAVRNADTRTAGAPRREDYLSFQASGRRFHQSPVFRLLILGGGGVSVSVGSVLQQQSRN